MTKAGGVTALARVKLSKRASATSAVKMARSQPHLFESGGKGSLAKRDLPASVKLRSMGGHITTYA